jgi:dUTP pyrophosphatase
MFTFAKIRDVKSPSRGTSQSAGMDFYVPNDFKALALHPGQSANIPSGIKLVIPENHAGIFFNKSGIAIKGLQVGACVVDADYRGEVHLNVHNHSDKIVRVEAGQKLVQMLIIPVIMNSFDEVSNEFYELMYNNTERGSGGFGSTGV